jgi:hypothetical protein
MANDKAEEQPRENRAGLSRKGRAGFGSGGTLSEGQGRSPAKIVRDAPANNVRDAEAAGHGGRWQSGVSGNPRGRPPSERALSTILRRLLRAPAPTQEGMSAREALCLQLLTRALEGDMAAIRLVLEYTDGKPAQRVEGSMTLHVMAPFTSDEAAAAHAELAAWEQEDASADIVRDSEAGRRGRGRGGEGERGSGGAGG